MSHCLRHYEEPPAGICRTCQQAFCTRCLVWSFGPKKPPFCVACALRASGVRPSHRTAVGGGAAGGAEVPAEAPVDKRLARAERRAERDAAKRAVRAERAARKRAGRGEQDGDHGPGGGGPGPGAPGPHDDSVVDLDAGSVPDSRVPAPSQLAAALRATPVPRGLMGAD